MIGTLWRWSCWRMTLASSVPVQPGMYISRMMISGENSSSASMTSMGSVSTRERMPAFWSTFSMYLAWAFESSTTSTR